MAAGTTARDGSSRRTGAAEGWRVGLTSVRASSAVAVGICASPARLASAVYPGRGGCTRRGEATGSKPPTLLLAWARFRRWPGVLSSCCRIHSSCCRIHSCSCGFRGQSQQSCRHFLRRRWQCSSTPRKRCSNAGRGSSLTTQPSIAPASRERAAESRAEFLDGAARLDCLDVASATIRRMAVSFNLRGFPRRFREPQQPCIATREGCRKPRGVDRFFPRRRRATGLPRRRERSRRCTSGNSASSGAKSILWLDLRRLTASPRRTWTWIEARTLRRHDEKTTQKRRGIRSAVFPRLQTASVRRNDQRTINLGECRFDRRG